MLYLDGMSQREIARRLRIANNTVRRIIGQKGAMPSIVRTDKIQLAPELLLRLHKQCNGEAQRVHETLTKDHGVEVGYSTLTCILRELGLRGFRGGRSTVKKRSTTRDGSRSSVVATRRSRQSKLTWTTQSTLLSCCGTPKTAGSVRGRGRFRSLPRSVEYQFAL